MPIPVKIEYAGQRRIRERNKKMYRVAHWPIWIWVFFLAPGPLTFDLFAKGPSLRNMAWLLVVMAGTGLAGIRGQLPGVEPRPYILRFTEDRPNPLYRKICYTFAWSDAITFASLNLAGLVLALGALGILPRVRRSTKGEGTERRYFYGTVWSVTLAQTLLMILWKILPHTHTADIIKLAAYVAALIALGFCATLGLLPRTRPIVPGELMVAD